MHYGLSAGGILRDNCLEFLAFFVCSFNNISYRHASLLEIEIVMTDYIRFLHIDKALGPQAIAERLNAEQVPTLSGRGHWSRGTVAKLLQQASP